jgi:exopolyphosphatase/pppGpp-phosphohydrolase
MRKFAVIDVGSNSVRLMFVADGKVLYKALNTTRLGEGLASSCFLKQETRLVKARSVCGVL